MGGLAGREGDGYRNGKVGKRVGKRVRTVKGRVRTAKGEARTAGGEKRRKLWLFLPTECAEYLLTLFPTYLSSCPMW